MSEKRFTLNLMKKPSEIEMDGKMISKYDVVRLLNGLSEENEQLKKQLSEYDEPKISIFNKDKGDWKWNDNNDIILNIRNGKSFYLRNSGAVENLVGLLNEQQATIKKLQDTLFAKEKTIDRLENTIAHLNQSDNSLKKNKKITELANIIHNMKMVLSNDEKQITKIIKAYQDEIDKWKGRTLILLKEMEDE